MAASTFVARVSIEYEFSADTLDEAEAVVERVGRIIEIRPGLVITHRSATWLARKAESAEAERCVP